LSTFIFNFGVFFFLSSIPYKPLIFFQSILICFNKGIEIIHVYFVCHSLFYFSLFSLVFNVFSYAFSIQTVYFCLFVLADGSAKLWVIDILILILSMEIKLNEKHSWVSVYLNIKVEISNYDPIMKEEFKSFCFTVPSFFYFKYLIWCYQHQYWKFY
jgi:hypothetical protein